MEIRGDVAARVAVRLDEIFESLRLIESIVDMAPDADLTGDVQLPLPVNPAQRLGLGFVEGWRGPVLVALENGPAGSIRRCHPHDVSWSNWPVLSTR